MSEARGVVVVGGGPAGSAAAAVLARAGVAVTVVDRARFPRDKCCGDGLTTGALRRLERLGLDLAAVRSLFIVDALWASSPSGRTVEVPLATSKGVFAAVAPRVDLDAALIDLARSTGAEVIEGDGVIDVARQPAGVAVTLSSGEVLSASTVLAADGARSTVRRLVREAAGASSGHAGELAGRDAWFAYRQYAHDVTGRADAELWVRFDPVLLPGYGWSFPLGGGRVNLGIGVPRRERTSGRALKSAWETTIRSPFFSSLLGDTVVLDGAVRAWPIPTGVRRSDLAAWDGRVLFLGDAAGTADPFSGEGIAQALESGILAAESLVADADRAGVAERYATALGHALFTEQRISRGARALLSSPLGARAALRGTALRPGVSRFVGRWLYEEYPRTAVVRPTTWPAVVRPHPGAYAGEGRG